MGLNLYKSLSEEALAKACCQRDGKAQRLFYEKFAPIMYPLCLRYVREVSEAEDVMISGFMKAFDKIDSYSGKGSLGGWLRRIMINQALGHLRKNKTMYLTVDIETVEYQSNLTWPEDHLEAEDLIKLVCQLPLGYRTVFNLYVIEGYSHKEISGLLEISENTSKSQLSRARGWLQKQLLMEEASIKSKITNNE
jgi:RNA polymerase sigma-70 factor (ECF subfamily)